MNLNELCKERDGPQKNKNTKKLDGWILSLIHVQKNSTGSTFGHVIRILATSCETMLHLLSSIN